MQEHTHVFELSFVPTVEGTITAPSVVFTVKNTLIDLIYERLLIVGHHNRENALAYFQGIEIPFQKVCDMYGLIHFGYGGVAIACTKKDKTEIAFRLHSHVLVDEIAMTLCLLMQVLNSDLRNEGSSNPHHLINFQTCVERRSIGYGHALGGTVSWKMVQWIRAYVAQSASDTTVQRHRLPPQVLDAMKMTWASISRPSLKQYANQCKGYVTSDGRFSLECFGDACDVAIYPDSSFEWRLEHGGAQLDCHNLDTADQQLTLIAGLAKLAELARTDIEKSKP